MRLQIVNIMLYHKSYLPFVTAVQGYAAAANCQTMPGTVGALIIFLPPSHLDTFWLQLYNLQISSYSFVIVNLIFDTYLYHKKDCFDS